MTQNDTAKDGLIAYTLVEAVREKMAKEQGFASWTNMLQEKDTTVIMAEMRSRNDPKWQKILNDPVAAETLMGLRSMQDAGLAMTCDESIVPNEVEIQRIINSAPTDNGKRTLRRLAEVLVATTFPAIVNQQG